jgi:hypothetical protein
VARAYYEPGRRLYGHVAAGDVYPAFRIAGYHATCAMEELMQYGLWAARVSRDAVSVGLVPYLERHLAEEQHAAEPGGLDLEDLAALGYNSAAVRASIWPHRLTDLADEITGMMWDRHPVAILGFLQLECYHGDVGMIDAFIKRTGLPPQAFTNMVLHAQVEPGHAAEIGRQLDTLPLRPWHEQLVYEAAAETLRALTAVFGQAVGPG